MELQLDVDAENAIWGNQNLPDLVSQRQRKQNYIIIKNTVFVTASSREYDEQIAIATDRPFEKIEDSLSVHKKILKFLNGDLFKVREDVQAVVTPRIQELINDIEEDADEEQSSIDFDSFKGFIYFLAKNNNVAIPSFIITCQGNIRALWRKSRKQHLAAEFHHDETVTYVVFAPNTRKPGKTMRSSGSISQRLLYKVAVSMGADKWIFK